MFARISLFLALLLISLVARAPAWLADTALSRATDGAVRLEAIEGTLWSGGGSLVVIDPVSRRAQPWTTLHWRWRPAQLLQLEASWSLALDNRPAGDIGASPRGWRADGLTLVAPARFLLERIPHAFGHLGWRGDVQFDTTQWRCNWKLACDGRFGLRWAGAAVDVLRGRPLGDYQLDARGEAGQLRFELATLAGDIRLNAQGNWTPGGPWHMGGTVQGDPEFLKRLPAVAGNWVSPTVSPGSYHFEIGG